MAKSASWDGKSLTGFMSSDRDYFENPIRGKSGQSIAGSDAAHAQRVAVDMAYGGGPRSAATSLLRAAGIPKDQYQYYADKAGITNVNSESDQKAIIAAYNADERYQGDGDKKKKKKKKEKYEPIETTPEQREKYDAITSRLRNEVAYKESKQREGYGDYTAYSDKKDYDMRDKDKDGEAMNFLNKKKREILTDKLDPMSVAKLAV